MRTPSSLNRYGRGGEGKGKKGSASQLGASGAPRVDPEDSKKKKERGGKEEMKWTTSDRKLSQFYKGKTQGTRRGTGEDKKGMGNTVQYSYPGMNIDRL